jgi:hypothetical protein
MNREMQIIREVNIQADIFYQDAVRLGDHAAFALGRDRRSQMTGLENIADSALKASDVFDYIKRQTARFDFWRQSIPPDKRSNEEKEVAGDMSFGERLIYYLEKEMTKNRKTIYDHLNIDESTYENQHLRRQIHLLLIRQFIHQMVDQYEFRVNPSLVRKEHR